jgi:tetratricopeptide (TPR) repeat protein/tRNA A-37 threonylcarbamoyl transferase component Bud32
MFASTYVPSGLLFYTIVWGSRAMAGNSKSDVHDVRALVQSVVLDVLRRRAAGESLPDEQVIASRPELADHLRVELSKLRQICEAGNGVKKISAAASTVGMGLDPTPGTFQVRCPHCREFFQASRDTPVAEIACSVCGGQFNIAGSNEDTRAAPALQSLAHFDLVELLGVGGFGSVWKARDRKLDRTVAIKIPHRGRLNHEDLEKFLREARAAAQLQHPNIVRVYEVGRDGDSAYIVSDFVRGIPLNDWLTGQQPTMRQAAEICATIADALQHAHERGVIHRDLKPANILIDGEGRPHLMDFGLARREVGEITVTLDGQVLGTPAYMSPEQACGEAHAADRRSDLYSLGVILFELITGELPFRGNPRMLMHQVIHDEPPSPRKFNSHIPKDLETITLKCLEKDPNRRYQAARELSGELRSFLAGAPIRARPISRAARAWRWVKRRPAAAALLATLFFVAIGAAAAFVRERDLRREVVAQKNEADRRRIEADTQRLEAQARKAEAESERDNAQAVVSFLTDDVLAKASPSELPDKAVRDTIVKALVVPAADTVGQRFNDKPLIEATIRHTLALTLKQLGHSDLALSHADAALRERRRILGEEHLDTAESVNTYASILQSLGRGLEAEPLYISALEQRRRILGEEHEDTLESLTDYGYLLVALGRPQEAESLLKQVFDRRQTVKSLIMYANVIHSLGRLQDAERLFRQALELSRELHREEHPEAILALRCYAGVLQSLGRTPEAEALFKQALEQSRKHLGEDHPDTITARGYYGVMLWSQNRAAAAEPYLKTALEQSRKVHGEEHPETIRALASYATVLQSLGRFEVAEPYLHQALEKSRKVQGEEHPDTIIALTNYGRVLRSLNRPEEAEPLHKQAFELSRKLLGESHPQTITLLSHYAGVLVSLGRPAEAEPLFKRVHEQRIKVLGEDHRHTVGSLDEYAIVMQLLGRASEVVPLYKEALARRRKVLGADHPATLLTLSSLASVYAWTKHRDESKTARDEICKQVLAKPRQPAAEESYWAASALLADGKLEENRRVCRQLLKLYEDTGETSFAVQAIHAYGQAPVPELDIRRLVAAAEAVNGDFPGNKRILGACLFRAGEFDRALEAFEESHRNINPTASDHCFLAMLHSKLGNDKRANKSLATARNLYQQEQELAVPWYSLIETENLLDEATLLIEGIPADHTE